MSLNDALANPSFNIFKHIPKKEFKNPPTVLLYKRTQGENLAIEIELKTDIEDLYKELSESIDSIVRKHLGLKRKKSI